MEIKNCPNCNARMIWNELLARWECKLCGYVEEVFQNPWKRGPRYFG